MAKMLTTVTLIAALAVTAGCSKKPPKELPPPPPSSQGDMGPPPPPSQVGSAIVPGSAADFLDKVGSDKVYFATDSYELDGPSQATLDKQAGWLNQYPSVKITIEGHCDERGTREYNLALGDRRANSVKNYLAGKGISTARITTISYGKERPAALGSDEEAWAQNRRAVTVVLN
ncbi:peptidoglycan-associated lipoprotein Pal [Flavisphingomonas formosensis]|uniref:peptidoglycan-associated lipoprotein Pal n=1 Tax=Flavisphingomonas formosensis TaxID=861534 RepID=UPI0012F77B5A|nr:peptidoglycan-associated lipoprotein Pal [Sphingomonas formosensis]